MPGFWEQMFGIVIIALAMVFGGFLYRKSHGGTAQRPSTSQPAKKKRPRKKDRTGKR
ncbi:MAG: hypothetical protein Q4B77_04070 [Coriobacteriaceae bacterium]|nr:hypothetical protein [Coriobacteriaceae bacterium]